MPSLPSNVRHVRDQVRYQVRYQPIDFIGTFRTFGIRLYGRAGARVGNRSARITQRAHIPRTPPLHAERAAHAASLLGFIPHLIPHLIPHIRISAHLLKKMVKK